MKTFEQYMKEHGGSVKIRMYDDTYFNVSISDNALTVRRCGSPISNTYHGAEDWAAALYSMLLAFDGITVRFCQECGRPMVEGLTDDCGDVYCCYGCMDNFLEREYPLGHRKSMEIGENGGWIEYKTESGEWKDTGLYETDWDDI